MVTSFGEKIKHRLSIIKGYIADCLDYMRWEYNNSNNYIRNSFESKLSRQAHVLEKGMSLKNPKPQFGVKCAKELLEYVSKYIGAGYSVEKSSAVINAIGVLRAYVFFHQECGIKLLV